jgi:GTP-binding protein
MLVTTIEYDNYVGRVVTGKVYSGAARVGDKVYGLTREGKPLPEARVTKIYRRRGLVRLEVDVVRVDGDDGAAERDRLVGLV